MNAICLTMYVKVSFEDGDREPHEHPGTLSIWDAAYRRCDETDEWHHDTSVVDLLESRHGNPYEGIRDETPPS
jgi:hypothetical protein